MFILGLGVGIVLGYLATSLLLGLLMLYYFRTEERDREKQR